MHQQTQNEDNRKPWKPGVLSIWTRDIAEIPGVYPYVLTQNIPSKAAEPVDKFITQMLAYERPYHPSQASEWLISDEDLFYEGGIYNCCFDSYVDMDKIVEYIDKKLEEW